MKKLLFIVLLISQTFWAQTAFEQGNKFYEKKITRLPFQVMKVFWLPENNLLNCILIWQTVITNYTKSRLLCTIMKKHYY